MPKSSGIFNFVLSASASQLSTRFFQLFGELPSAGSELPPQSTEPRKYFAMSERSSQRLEIDLCHLADFFIERHLLQQRFDFVVDVGD